MHAGQRNNSEHWCWELFLAFVLVYGHGGPRRHIKEGNEWDLPRYTPQDSRDALELLRDGNIERKTYTALRWIRRTWHKQNKLYLSGHLCEGHLEGKCPDIWIGRWRHCWAPRRWSASFPCLSNCVEWKLMNKATSGCGICNVNREKRKCRTCERIESLL